MQAATGGSWGQWWLAAVLIVIASWLLYRYVAPKSWREWGGAGLVQAFIIALYAEMYGFPLTIYVLTTVVGIKIPWLHVSGHLWAALLGFGYIGAIIEMVVGWSFVLLGLSLLIQGWRELHRANREGRLATRGVYGVVRHPQYTGIFLALFGQLVHWPTIPTLALFPVIVWAYVRLAQKEERRLLETVGLEYRVYQGRVPKFLPHARDLARLLRAGSPTLSEDSK